MGGLKRKIDTEKKIEKKDSRAVAFSKRRKGLYSKAAELCLLSDAQMAIIATPVSSKSHNAFYSFGHSSADAVVAAFLTDEYDHTPDEKLGFWWEDENLANSEDPEELGNAIDLMKSMLNNLCELEDNNNNAIDHHQHHSVLVENNNENQLGLEDYFDQIDSEVHETHSQAYVDGGCTNQLDVDCGNHDDVSGCNNNQLGLDFPEVESQPMIGLDDEEYNNFFSSDFFNDIDIDALFA